MNVFEIIERCAKTLLGMYKQQGRKGRFGENKVEQGKDGGECEEEREEGGGERGGGEKEGERGKGWKMIDCYEV